MALEKGLDVSFSHSYLEPGLTWFGEYSGSDQDLAIHSTAETTQVQECFEYLQFHNQLTL